jgi:hypothetical protein
MFARVLRAAAAYFAVTFAAGFALGTIRVAWLVPVVGERAAELMEMPVMVAVVILAARWTARRFSLGKSFLSDLAVGGVALILLLAVELTVVLALRGLSLAEYVHSRDPVAGLVYVLSLALFAFMPAWLGLRSRE